MSNHGVLPVARCLPTSPARSMANCSCAGRPLGAPYSLTGVLALVRPTHHHHHPHHPSHHHQFKDLKNQEVTIRKLEDQVDDLEEQIEAKVT